MAAFRYRALDSSGNTVSGVLDAETAREARTNLRAQGLFPFEISSAGNPGGGLWKGINRVSESELSLLTRQWASLLDAGLTLEQTLGALHDQAEAERVRKVLGNIRSEVRAGLSLFEALRQYPGIFPEIYLSLVSAGERSGKLADVLARLADYLESRQQMRNKLLQAMLYPAVITIIAALVIVGMMTYVVPQVITAFQHGKQSLPFLTQALIWTSSALRIAFPWLIAGGVIGATLFTRALRKEAFKQQVHRALLKVPVVGKMLRTIDSARFAQTLAILVGAGVPLLSALDATRKVVMLIPLRRAIANAAEQVREGRPLAASLAASKQFPALLVHLIGSGERSGKLHHMLDRAAQQQQDEVNNRITLLVGLLEPALIVVMGGIVLVIVLAILQPIIEINQLMR